MPIRTCPFPIIEATSSRDLMSAPVDRVKAAVVETGGVLIRGFDLDVETFSAFSKQFMTKLFVHLAASIDKSKLDDPKAREGFGGRIDLTADGTVSTVNIGKEGVPLHGDMSPYPMRPDLAFFGCIKPSESGGETTVGEGTAIPEALKPETREFLSARRMKWMLKVSPDEFCRMLKVERGGLRGALDEWSKIAEARGERATFKYRSDHPELFAPGGEDTGDTPDPDDVFMEYVTPVLPKRKSDGRRVFCSHLLNAARFDNKLYGNPKYPNIGTKRCSSAETYEMFRDNMAQNACILENGEPIPDQYLDDLERACAEIEYPHPWRSGDVIMIDNWRTPHGRHRYTDLSRRIVTTFGYCDFVEKIVTL